MIAHHGADHRPSQTAERSRREPTQDQGPIGRSQGTGERCQAESRIQNDQRPLAVETVEDKSSGKTANGGGDSVRRDQASELTGSDIEHRHELRPERQHDHEIQNMSELHGSQREERGTFARG